MAIHGTVHIARRLVKPREKTPEVKAEMVKLEKLTEETESVIYEISSVFPFQLFPDRLILDKNKLTVVRKDLLIKRIFPILIEDIMTVKVNRGPLFASIVLEARGYEMNPNPITFLKPEDASRAEKYILGLIKAKREGVDLSKLSTSEIKGKLAQIGGSTEEVKTLF
jgi:hypothetical protein